MGGELVTSMLDLCRDEVNGCLSAPLQMKANNGILLIDDFGRQMSSPRDLLNRWIVPLDRRVDFLSIGSGGKFDIPFELQIVFSTNLAPQELADEAFLRRIPNKIRLESVDADRFDKIFGMTAAAAGMAYEEGCEELLRELCLRHSSDLRPCFPRDILTRSAPLSSMNIESSPSRARTSNALWRVISFSRFASAMATREERYDVDFPVFLSWQAGRIPSIAWRPVASIVVQGSDGGDAGPAGTPLGCPSTQSSSGAWATLRCDTAREKP